MTTQGTLPLAAQPGRPALIKRTRVSSAPERETFNPRNRDVVSDEHRHIAQPRGNTGGIFAEYVLRKRLDSLRHWSLVRHKSAVSVIQEKQTNGAREELLGAVRFDDVKERKAALSQALENRATEIERLPPAIRKLTEQSTPPLTPCTDDHLQAINGLSHYIIFPQQQPVVVDPDRHEPGLLPEVSHTEVAKLRSLLQEKTLQVQDLKERLRDDSKVHSGNTHMQVEDGVRWNDFDVGGNEGSAVVGEERERVTRDSRGEHVQIVDQDAECERLRSQVEELQKTIETLRQECVGHLDEAATLRRCIGDLATELAALKDQINILHERLNQAETKKAQEQLRVAAESMQQVTNDYRILLQSFKRSVFVGVGVVAGLLAGYIRSR